ncbi:MAG: crotonase/enoyl-CoA hydratase family protein [Polyangiales bacterium]
MTSALHDLTSNLVSLRLDIREHVADVVLRGPSKGNAMGPDFWRECPRVFEALDRDESVRAIVVSGDGNHFTYGLDLPAMMGDLGPVLSDGLAAARTKLHDKVIELQRAFQVIASCRKPVIAAVHGWCIGGGVDMIAACDVRLCTKDAKFSVREVKVAMVADIGSLQRLPAIIGHGHTRELAFTGKDIDAARALRIGLVNDVYDGKESLLEAAHAMAREIAANPPLVVQGVKQVLEAAHAPAVDAGLRYVAAWNSAFLPSKDLGEAFGAFLERRPPKFSGG